MLRVKARACGCPPRGLRPCPVRVPSQGGSAWLRHRAPKLAKGRKGARRQRDRLTNNAPYKEPSADAANPDGLAPALATCSEAGHTTAQAHSTASFDRAAAEEHGPTDRRRSG